MIKARNSNNEYVNIEDIKYVKSGETKDIEYIKDNLGNVLYSKYKEIESEILPTNFISKDNKLKNYRIYGNTETKTRSYNGTAPLSFPIEDGVVSNYRIYGNTVDGESVGDLVETGEHTGEYLVPMTVNDTTTDLYLPEPLKMVGGKAEYVDFREQKQHRVRKNLLQNMATNQTINDVMFTVNDDGSVTCDGTSSDGIMFYLSDSISFSENVKLTGCPIGGGENKFFLRFTRDDGKGQYIDSGSGSKNIPANVAGKVNIRVFINYTYDNLTFYPMIRKADISDDTYEPYIENTELDVIIPALPAQSTTNSLSVGTAIQPSSVAVDVDEVVSCGDKVTDIQSVNYGKYKIPVTLTTNTSEMTNIYLDTPLTKSGNNTDYVDFKTQKRYNSDGIESIVALPEIAVTTGTNTLTIGTEVQPSKVYLKGKIKEIN